MHCPNCGAVITDDPAQPELTLIRGALADTGNDPWASADADDPEDDVRAFADRVALEDHVDNLLGCLEESVRRARAARGITQ